MKLEEQSLNNFGKTHLMQTQYSDKKVNPENNESMRNNKMAPSDNYKFNYQKFMNFQRFHLFQSQKSFNTDQLLGIFQLNKLNRVITIVYQNYKNNELNEEDIKGLWPIISFIFPQRTGLSLNQFFLMIITKKLNHSSYQNNSGAQIKEFMNKVLQQKWYKESEFIAKISILLKQIKSSKKQQANEIRVSFGKVTSIFAKYKQTAKYIQNLIEEMKRQQIIFKKQLKPQHIVKNKPNFVPVVDGASIFDPNDRYVLSQPDTFIADVCNEFQEKEYKILRRKYSFNHNEHEDDETATNFFQRTAEKSTPFKDHQKMIGQYKQKQGQVGQFKRKIHFKLQVQNKDTHETTLKKQIKNIRPPRQKYIQKMIFNQRKIEKTFDNRIQTKKDKRQNQKKIKKHNNEISKQIRKTFVDASTHMRRQKRNLSINNYANHMEYQHKSSSRQRQRSNQKKQKSIYKWNEKFVEDESINSFIQMEVEVEDSQDYSAKYPKEKRKISNKRENRRTPSNNQQQKRRNKNIMSYRKQQNIMQSDDESNHQQKNQMKVRNRILNQQKVVSGNRRVNFKKNMFETRKQRKQPDVNLQNQRKPQVIKPKKLKKSAQVINEDESIEQFTNSQFLHNENTDSIEYGNPNQTNISFNKNNNFHSYNPTNPPSKLLSKYSYLTNPLENKKQIVSGNNNKNNLNNFLNKNKQDQTYQPLQRMEIRKLAILQFDDLQETENQPMQIQGDEIHQTFYKMKKQKTVYEAFNMRKMNFDIMEYINYLKCLQNQEDVLKEIKQTSQEYLSKSFINNLNSTRLYNSKDQSVTIKLISISRKILAFYILAKNQSQSHQKVTYFYKYFQTYINPLLKHYTYKVLIHLISEITNALYSSEGDEDFQVLNETSLPLMILLHDIRELMNYKKNPQLKIIERLYEDFYQLVRQQLNFILADFVQSSQSRNKKFQEIIKQNLKDQKSKIYLPRSTKSLFQKDISIKLRPNHMCLSIYTSILFFQTAFYEKIKFFYLNLSKREDIKFIREQRNKNLTTRLCAQFSEMFLEILTQNSLQMKQKINQTFQFVQIIEKILRLNNFSLSQRQNFENRCKIFIKCIQNLKNIEKNSSSIDQIVQNLRKSEQNNKKNEILNVCKKILNFTLTQFIESQINNNPNLNPLLFLNQVLIQHLKEIKEIKSDNLSLKEAFIHIEINLQINNAFMKYKIFRENDNFNKVQIIKTAQKIIIQIQNKPTLLIYGENRQSKKGLIKNIFDLLLSGYQVQIYDHGNIWLNNDNFLKSSSETLLAKKDNAQNYWMQIKGLISLIYKKYQNFRKNMQDQRKDKTVHLIQLQKLKKYSNLLKYMISKLTQNILYKLQSTTQPYFYKQCTQNNSICYSLRHIIFNVCPLFSEYNMFIDLEFDQQNMDQKQCQFIPFRLLQYINRIILVSSEIQIRQNITDQQQIEDELLDLQMQRKNLSLQITKLWLKIMCSNSKNLTQYFNRQNNLKHPKLEGFMSIIQSLQPLYQQKNKNDQNQNLNPRPNQSSRLQVLIRKYDFLKFEGNSNFNLEQKSLTDISNFQLFLSQFSKIFMFLNQFSTSKEQVLSDLGFKKIFFLNSNKELTLKVIAGALIHKIIILSQIQNQDFSRDNQPQNQYKIEVQKVITIMKLWCKIYQICFNIQVANSSYKPLNITDLNSFLYCIFKNQCYNKKLLLAQAGKQTPTLFSQIMANCLILSQSKSPDRLQIKKQFSAFAQSLYSTMKSLYKSVCNHQQQIVIDRAPSYSNKKQFKNKYLIQSLLQNFILLFTTVVKWPELLIQVIKKLKIEFQNSGTFIIINNQPLRTTNQNNKPFLDNLIFLNKTATNEDQYEEQNLKENILRKKAYIICQCLNQVDKIQANIFSIKEIVRNYFLLFLLKKSVQYEHHLLAFTVKPKNTFNNPLQSLSNAQNINVQKQFKFLKTISLNLLKEDTTTIFASQFISLLLKALDKNNKKIILNNQALQNSLSKEQTLLNQIHSTGRKNIEYYKERVLYTFFITMKESHMNRNVIQNVFWQNCQKIQDFMIFNPNQNSKKQFKSIEEIIQHCMIGLESDFYLIKMMLCSRIKIFLKLRQINQPNHSKQNLISQPQYSPSNGSQKLDLQTQKIKLNIIQCVKKAIFWSQTINNRQNFSRYNTKNTNQSFKCNQDLQNYFKAMLIIINEKNIQSNMINQAGQLVLFKKEDIRENHKEDIRENHLQEPIKMQVQQ